MPDVVIAIVVNAAMHQGAIIPKNCISGPPMMAEYNIGPGYMAEKKREQRAAFIGCELINPHREPFIDE